VPVDVNFQISPLRSGVDALSPFLNDPSAEEDELDVRTRYVQDALCAP
jgi:hypothetical protein